MYEISWYFASNFIGDSEIANTLLGLRAHAVVVTALLATHPVLFVGVMASVPASVLADRVTSAAHAAAVAVAEAELSDPVNPYPSGVVVSATAVLRDLYVVHHARGRSRFSLASARWSDVAAWCNAFCHPITPWRPFFLHEPLSDVRLSSRTSWMSADVVTSIYNAVWMMKRFVAVPDGDGEVGGAYRVRSGGSWHAMAAAPFPSLGSCGPEDLADDELLNKQSDVEFVLARRDTHLDIRAWQVVLALGGQDACADALLRWAAWRGAGGDASSEQPARRLVASVPTSPVLPLKLYHREVLGVDDADAADFADNGASVAVLRPFELILSLSCFAGLEQDVRRASAAPASSRAASDPGEKALYEERLTESLCGSFARIRGIVHDVVSGWDAVARTRGFRSAEVMLSDYLFWSSSAGGYVALGRPEDALAGVVASDGKASDAVIGGDPLIRGRARAWSEEGLEDKDAAPEILPLGDSQLRAAAGMMLEHLYTCTAAGPLGIPVSRSMVRRLPPSGSQAASIVSQRGSGSGSGAVGGAASSSGASVKKRKVLGRLTVEMYRRPAWDRLSGSVPPTLKTVANGLTAFSIVPAGRHALSLWTASTAVLRRSQSPLCPGDQTSLELAFRADSRVAGLYAEQPAPGPSQPGAGGRRGPLLLTSRLSSVPAEVAVRKGGLRQELQEAWRVVDGVLSQVAVTYVCSFDDLVRTHAEAWAERSRLYPARRSAGHVGGSMAGGAPARTVLPQYLGSQVQLVLSDPPYGTRLALNLDQSAHDVLTAEHMRSAAVMFQRLVRPGGHLLLFCSPKQLDVWIETLRSLVDANPLGKQRQPAFRVDNYPLVAVKEPHAVNSMRQNTTHLSNKVEFIVHATRCGASAEDAFVQVNYRTWNALPSRFMAYDNVIDNVRPPHYNEVIRRRRDGSRPWLRPEQKSLALILELVLRFSQPGDIVVDAFAGTCVTAAASIRGVLGQHRLVVCCDSDPVVIDASRPRVRREFVNQVLTGGYASSGLISADVVDAARVVNAESVAVAAAAARLKIQSRRQRGRRGGAPEGDDDDGEEEEGPQQRSDTPADIESEDGQTEDKDGVIIMMDPPESTIGDGPDWESPPGLPCHSAVPVELLRYFAGTWAARADMVRAGRVPGTPGLPMPGAEVGPAVMKLEGVGVGNWPHQFQCELAVTDVDVGLHVAAAHLGVFVARSRLAGGMAGRGVFALRPFKRGAVIGPFWGAVVYADLNKKRVKTARYAAAVLGSLGPTVRDFSERAMEVVLDDADTAEGAAGDGGGGPRKRQMAHVRRRGAKHEQRSAQERGGTEEAAGTRAEVVPAPTAGSSMYVVPSPLCVMGYVNDGRPTSAIDVEAASAAAGRAAADAEEAAGDDEDDEEEGSGDGGAPAGGDDGGGIEHGADAGGGRWTGVAQPNVRIWVNARHGSGVVPAEFVRPDLLMVSALRDISVGEEMVADYGADYVFVTPEWERRGRASGGGVLLSHSTPHTFGPMCM